VVALGAKRARKKWRTTTVGQIALRAPGLVPFNPIARGPSLARSQRINQVANMRLELPAFIKAWFAVDLVLALFPPVHWAMSGVDPILGIPRSLFYIYGTSFVIAASVVAAYFSDRSLRARQAGAG
jgi:hypothetical protein